MPLRLTARNVMSLSSGGRRRADYLDEVLPGFELRVSSAGARTFAVRYFRDGKVRRYTIGRTPPLSLADARDVAKRILGDVMKGGDPHADKVAQRRKRAQQTESFGALCERFLDEARTKDNLPLRQSTLYNWRNIAKVEILPALGEMTPETITRRDVRLLIEGIAAQRPYWANRVFELVRRVFSWAMERDLVNGSPCVGLKKPGGERPRDRVLSTDEIRRIWSALDEAGSFGEAVRLLFYTAARPREVLNARWAEVDVADRLWRIPAERMKNREPHVVPLSGGALALVERIASTAHGAEFLFPSPACAGPLIAVAKPVRRIRERSGVQCQLRDIRRTVRTRLREMGAPQDVAEAILSHARPRLIRTYDRYEPVPEMRAVLDAWSTRLEAIVTGEIVRADVLRLARA